MLTYERSGRSGWILRVAAVLIVTASALAGAAAPATQPAAVELKPTAIVLDIVPQAETKASCVLRYRGEGELKILSAESTDPAMKASWREGAGPGISVVTATFPPGYSVPEGGKVELVVKTEVAEPTTAGVSIDTWGRSVYGGAIAAGGCVQRLSLPRRCR